MENLNIIICGVGGQGIVLSSSILSKVFCNKYEDIKSTDIIGVGQRGGSVVTHIRAGKKVFSPMVKANEADFIVAFEKYEALRWQHMLKEDGVIILNDKMDTPNTVLTGLEEDIDIEYSLKTVPNKVHLIHCNQILKEKSLSNKYTNILMMGYLSKFIPIDNSFWLRAIEESVKQQYIPFNLEVFTLGRELGIGMYPAELCIHAGALNAAN